MEVKTLTSSERRRAIATNLAAHLTRMPAGWESWDAERTRRFKGDVLQLPAAKSLNKATPIAQRIAEAYGAPWATIDPGAT